MRKDYYLILGVARTATADAIRSAYRELAKRYHPDHTGPGGASDFREIQEAYEVLSDPGSKAQLDRELKATAEQEAQAGTGPVATPEPLISEPVPIGDRPGSIRPSLEGFLERVARNFSGIGVPKAERAEALNYELILSPEEAGRGVVVPFTIPVFQVCVWCGGSGNDWGFPCDRCDAQGRRVTRETVRLHLPAGVRPGTVIDVSLRELGVENFYLRVQVRVA
jgi:DnaJ-class molecular chaperone